MPVHSDQLNLTIGQRDDVGKAGLGKRAEQFGEEHGGTGEAPQAGKSNTVFRSLLHATHSSVIVTFIMGKFKYVLLADFYTRLYRYRKCATYFFSKVKTFSRSVS